MTTAHQPLARRYRPKRFEDVIGQRGVVDTLRNALASGRIAQSFIFAGPRGVGKTTTARLLAKALNCVTGPTPTPCSTCDICVEIAEGRDFDVLEIDAATHTGVDDVRQVIVEPLALAPMRGRYKIFIIDEVHRLSKQAFDALLKSIEEPPPYVKFMMATTDPQHVPETIKSRSQVFELKALPFASIRDQLRTVMAEEGIEIEDAALALVARHAEGSMRDALSALDQVLAFSSERVTADDVSTVLGVIGRDLQFEIAETVAAEDLGRAFELAGQIVGSGVDLRLVCRELARLMRDLMVLQIDPSRYDDPEIASEGERARLEPLVARYSREDLMRAFDLLSRAEWDIRQSSQPRHTFEMTLVKWIHLRRLTPLTELIARLESGQPTGLGAGAAGGGVSGLRPGAAPAPAPGAPVRRPAPMGAPPPATSPAPTTRPGGGRSLATPRAASTSSAPEPSSPPPARRPAGDPKTALLQAVRESSRAFYGMVVAQAQSIELEGDTLTFTFAAVHRTLKSQLEARRGWLGQLAQSVLGRTLTIVAKELPPDPAPAREAQAAVDPRRADLEARVRQEPAVQAILDVFGAEIEDIEELS